MTIQASQQQIKIILPDTLYQWLDSEANRRDQDISTIIQIALEHYVHNFDLTRTRTWQLCGAFAVAEAVEQDETEKLTTNYAESVDDVLYG